MLKELLRKEIISSRMDFYNSDNYQRSSKLICDNIKNFLNDSYKINNKTIGCYYPTKGEVDITSIYSSYKLAFPRIIVVKDHSEIEYAKIASPQELESSHLGIKAAPKNLEICYPEILLIPGIVFDKKYHRIGYGKGHFDKFLLKAKKSGYNPLKIGICFDFQLTEELPKEKHDQTMDLIITESKVYINAS